MVNYERCCDFLCRYFLKILIIFVASSGVVLSVLASNSCRFLYLGPEVFTVIDPGLQNQTEGWIGIFFYESNLEECSVYQQNVLQVDAPNAALLASQISAIMAPGLACIGIFVSTIELVCCRFYGSFVAACFLFLVASLFQCGTFAMFVTQEGSCFDEDLCELGNAAYMSGVAVFLFCASCIVLCCSPRPRPCMQNINEDLQLKLDHDNNNSSDNHHHRNHEESTDRQAESDENREPV